VRREKISLPFAVFVAHCLFVSFFHRGTAEFKTQYTDCRNRDTLSALQRLSDRR
jgi:hypothetical protein